VRSPEQAQPGVGPAKRDQGSVRGSQKARLGTDTCFEGLVGELKARARDAGLDALGIASGARFDDAERTLTERKAAGLHGGMHFTYGNPARSTDPARALPGARAIVVGARRYRRQPPSTQPRFAGRVAAYSWHDHYAELRDALEVATQPLVDAGWKRRVLADDNALVDRAAAQRAGLGWFGKNTNVLVPGIGSWVVLGSVLTDAPLPADEPAADGCGSCSRCLPACPTGALIAPGVLDARRCLAWLLQAPGSFPLEFRDALGDRMYGCDDCQTVCPPNNAAERRRAPDAADADDEPWVDVVAMLDLDDDALLATYGRWYIARRQPRYLRRNALVVLGNVGDGRDGGVERVLRRSLSSEDGLIREHAEWAARRLGRDDLLAAS
jgi:epoxyqueuosine reductase